jgi:hypothetical protein
MKPNMGTIDRIVRVLIAVVVAVLYFTKVIDGVLAIVLGVVAGILLLTSVVGFCGLYTLLGINTCSVKSK